MMSSTFSMPTARRIVAWEMPARVRPCSSDCECVVVAGWTTSERTSPMLATLECSFSASTKAHASAVPAPSRSKDSTPPAPARPSFSFVACHGEEARPA